MYGPIYEEVRQAAPGPGDKARATPSDVFAKGVATALLAEHPPLEYIAGAGAGTVGGWRAGEWGAPFCFKVIRIWPRVAVAGKRTAEGR